MQNRRKIKYVDQNIQGYLMGALIALESLMIIVAMVYLYHRFNAIFDDNIYQIHKSASEPIYKLLGYEMLKVVIAMSLVNFTALFVANQMWLSHIKRIITFFRESMLSVKQLSLKFPDADDVPQHDLTVQLIKWQQHEIDRDRHIKEVIEAMPLHADQIDHDKLSDQLKLLKHQLKFTRKKQ